jgi:hypothetical protein
MTPTFHEERLKRSCEQGLTVLFGKSSDFVKSRDIQGRVREECALRMIRAATTHTSTRLHSDLLSLLLTIHRLWSILI